MGPKQVVGMLMAVVGGVLFGLLVGFVFFALVVTNGAGGTAGGGDPIREALWPALTYLFLCGGPPLALFIVGIRTMRTTEQPDLTKPGVSAPPNAAQTRATATERRARGGLLGVVFGWILGAWVFGPLLTPRQPVGALAYFVGVVGAVTGLFVGMWMADR
jgi:hypothetical protein